MNELFALLERAKLAIQKTSSLPDLERIRVDYLGKKGQVTDLLKQLANLPADQKPQLGKEINTVKKTIEHLLQARISVLRQDALKKQLTKEIIDVTLPGRGDVLGSLHPVTQVTERAVSLLTAAGFRVAEGPEIEDEFHNFEALNIPPEHPARAMHDSFYTHTQHVLRTHTSPVQVRELLRYGAPTRLVCVGRVFRRDLDQTHTPMFHQLEGLVVDRHSSFSELKGVIYEFLQRFFEKSVKIRFRPSYFPFTEPSAEVDIFDDETSRWLEVLGCGMVHPRVFHKVNINPEIFRGFAFGVGLDRLAMIRYGIPDLRLLFENDLRFLEQF